MTISKILEGTLIAGQTSVVFTDADIPNSLVRVFSNNPDIIPVSRTLSGNSLTVVYEPQANNISVAVELVKAGLDIVDALNSTDADKALSAKQGKALNDAIASIVVPSSYPASAITYDNTTSGMTADNVQDAIDEVFQSVSDGKELIADAITDKGVPTSASDSFQTMADNIASISGGGSGKVYYIRTVNTSGSNAAISVMSCEGATRLYYNTNLRYSVATSPITIGDITVQYNSSTYNWQVRSSKQIFSVANNDYLSVQPTWYYTATYENMLVTT